MPQAGGALGNVSAPWTESKSSNVFEMTLLINLHAN